MNTATFTLKVSETTVVGLASQMTVARNHPFGALHFNKHRYKK
ncbi:hypothetical protein [Tychonema sp. LEGE 07203]|nr:hypothetical protein [Tychonema sp. LEGE 07203]